MVVHLTDEQTAQISRLAAQTGRSAEDLVREAVDLYLVEDALHPAANRMPGPNFGRTEFLDASEVWARMERELQS